MTALGKMQQNTIARSANAVVAACKRYDGYGKKEKFLRPQWGLFTMIAQKSAAFYTGLIREWRTMIIKLATVRRPGARDVLSGRVGHGHLPQGGIVVVVMVIFHRYLLFYAGRLFSCSPCFLRFQ
jgi:hypothetical protein